MHSFDFAGNLTAKQTLASFCESGRFPHAIIIEGPCGCGKKSFANIMAKTLVCQEENKPCGVCSSCKKAENETHPDITVLGSDGGSRSFHIQTIREMKKNIFIRPNDSDKKIYILNHAENMTEQAQNALLKILEEPPSYGVFILTTENKTALLDTVLSRAVVISLLPVEASESIEYLHRLYPEKAKDLLEQVIYRTGGVIGKAKELLLQEGDAGEDLAAVLCRAVTEPREYALVEAVACFEKDKAGFAQCLNRCMLIFRDAVVYKAGAENLQNSSKELVSYLSQRLTSAQMVKAIENIQETLVLLDHNVNYGLLLSCFCQKLNDAVN